MWDAALVLLKYLETQHTKEARFVSISSLSHTHKQTS